MPHPVQTSSSAATDAPMPGLCRVFRYEYQSRGTPHIVELVLDASSPWAADPPAFVLTGHQYNAAVQYLAGYVGHTGSNAATRQHLAKNE